MEHLRPTRKQLAEWMPLVMEGRENCRAGGGDPREAGGTDVNFGALTRRLIAYLKSSAAAFRSK